ncbi:MAG: hypothetical protein ABIF04_00010 [Chloroflexota bacterium]
MRRALLVAIPVLGMGIIFQTSIVSRMILLSGNADLILLILAAWGLQERSQGAWVWGIAATLLVGMASGIPWYIYLIGYMAVVGMARLLMNRIWQAPLLAMFAVTLTGTLGMLMLMFIERTFLEVPLTIGAVFSQIVLPSILLNLLLAIPVHALIRSLVNRLYPEEVNA